jgi:hypothetical protein
MEAKLNGRACQLRRGRQLSHFLKVEATYPVNLPENCKLELKLIDGLDKESAFGNNRASAWQLAATQTRTAQIPGACLDLVLITKAACLAHPAPGGVVTSPPTTT